MSTIKKAVVTTQTNGLLFQTQTDVFPLDAADLSDEIKHQAMLHGLKQKIADSYAGLKTTHEIDGAIQGVISTLTSGQWNSGRSSSGGLWVEALARASGESLEECQLKWSSMDEDSQKAVKKHPQVKTAKAEIDLERAKIKAKGSTLDLDDLV